MVRFSPVMRCDSSGWLRHVCGMMPEKGGYGDRVRVLVECINPAGPKGQGRKYLRRCRANECHTLALSAPNSRVARG